MHGIGGLEGFRWIFLIEGIPSIIFGIVCWWYLPDFPFSASFLSEKERLIATQRLEAEQGNSISDTSFDFKQCIATMTHLRTWLFSILYFCLLVPLYSFSFFIPSQVARMGFVSLDAQLLSSPPYVATFFITIFWAYSSDRRKERAAHTFLPLFFQIFGFFALAMIRYNIFTIRYALIVFTVSMAFASLPPVLAWHSSAVSSESNTVRATSTAMMVSVGNLGGLAAPYIYGDEQLGHMMCGCLSIVGCILTVSLYFYMRNK